MTYCCGFKVDSGEYKLMDRAPYGQPIYADKIRDELFAPPFISSEAEVAEMVERFSAVVRAVGRCRFHRSAGASGCTSNPS